MHNKKKMINEKFGWIRKNMWVLTKLFRIILYVGVIYFSQNLQVIEVTKFGKDFNPF